MITHTTGAIPALRGYRTQFLYTLYRLLHCKEDEVFHPEKHEDYTVMVSGRMTEVTQIKTGKLILSAFEPRKEDSFFRRLFRMMEKSESPRFILVSFGELGEDFEKGDKSTLLQKLTQNYGYDVTLTAAMLNRLEVIQADEKEIEKSIRAFLGDTVSATDPDIAKDLLLFWMYLAAERQESITRQQLIEKVNIIGQFISERKGFLTQIGSTLLPLTDQSKTIDHERLRSEFMAGVSAQYTHILADLDVVRPLKIGELDQCFEKSNLVILHGASGQGKSTLAYRYAYERYPASYVWQVKEIQNVPELRKAIHALSRPFETSFLIIVEVQPRDNNWVRFCADIAAIPQCRVLVCIREEDLKRADSVDEYITPAPLNLEFTKVEAEEIYNRIEERDAIHHFLNFEEAWAKFGGQGPLLEFVYLLRQGKTLRDRLGNQLERIKKETRTDQDQDQIQLLKLVALAGTYDARLDLRRTIQALQLHDAQQTIRHFEAEYLIRSSADGASIEALHPVRARVMMELLFDPIIDPIAEAMVKSFDFILEEDIGIFLLHYFYEHGWAMALGEKLERLRLTQWRVCESMLTSLLWMGVKAYIEENNEAIEQLKAEEPDGWRLFVMIFIADGVDFSSLREMIGEERWSNNQTLLSKFTDKHEFYKFAKDWLNKAKLPGTVDVTTEQELSSLGKLLFWINRLDTDQDIHIEELGDFHSIDQETFISAEALADLLMGLYHNRNGGEHLAEQILPAFKAKFCVEQMIPIIEDDGVTIKAHFLFNVLEEQEAKDGNMLHTKAIRIINALRRATPHRLYYASQCYGHRFKMLPGLPDDTTKRIPAENLPFPWITEWNGVFLNLIDWQDRPEDWNTLADNLYTLRDQIFNRLAALGQALTYSYKKNDLTAISKFHETGSSIDWNLKTDKLPKSSVDHWGFVGDFSERDTTQNLIQKFSLIQLVAPEFKSAVKSIKDFHFSVQTFGSQADKALLLKDLTKNWTLQDWDAKEELLRQLKYPKDLFRLSKLHLQNTWEHFPKYLTALQKYFAKHANSSLNPAPEPRDLETLLLVWHHFISEKLTRKEPDIKRVVRTKEKAIWQEINNKLHLRLQALKRSGLVAETETLTFNELPGQVFIVLYVKDWIYAFAAATEAVKALREILQPAPYSSFRRLVIDKAIEKYWIVPIWEDITPNRSAFSLPIYQLLDSSELEALKITNVAKLTDEMVKVLEVRVGTEIFNELRQPEEFITHYQIIMVLLHSLSQLKDLFGNNDIGDMLLGVQVQSAILKMYDSAQKLESLLAKLLQDLRKEIADERFEYLDPEIAEKTRLILPIFEGVVMWEKQIQDSGLNTDTFILLVDWDQRMSALEEAASRVYLGWSSLLTRRFTDDAV